MKNLGVVAFAVTMVLYLWFPTNMISHTQRILKNGTKYRFSLQPIDPYDIFRGYYVILNYKNPMLPVSDTIPDYQKVYVTIGRDAEGLSYFDKVYETAPDNQDYITTKISYYTGGKVQLNIPENMNYYYLNKKTAPQVEEAIARTSQPDSLRNRAFVDVRVHRGEVVVEQLYINDLPVQSYLKK